MRVLGLEEMNDLPVGTFWGLRDKNNKLIQVGKKARNGWVDKVPAGVAKVISNLYDKATNILDLELVEIELVRVNGRTTVWQPGSTYCYENSEGRYVVLKNPIEMRTAVNYNASIWKAI